MATSWALILASALPLGQHVLRARRPRSRYYLHKCGMLKQRNMTLLKQALLTGYDMTVQPPRFGSERGALVSVQLAMQQFQKLDTTNQEITFFSWQRHQDGPSISVGPEGLGRHHGTDVLRYRRGVELLCVCSSAEKTDPQGHDEHKQIWVSDTIIYDAVESVFQVPGGVQPNVYSAARVPVRAVETRLASSHATEDVPLRSAGMSVRIRLLEYGTVYRSMSSRGGVSSCTPRKSRGEKTARLPSTSLPLTGQTPSSI